MSKFAFVSVFASLAILLPAACFADTFQAAQERVQKEQHLAMIEGGISSLNARTISLLGLMVFAHRTCGDAAVTMDDAEGAWSVQKMGASPDDATRKAMTERYADALAKAVDNLASFDKHGFCDETSRNIAVLKKDWGF